MGLLALNALFTLIKDYNLYGLHLRALFRFSRLAHSDYPSFYTRLYTFLDRDVLHLKHRARFFRLTEIFLSSTYVPSPSSVFPSVDPYFPLQTSSCRPRCRFREATCTSLAQRATRSNSDAHSIHI